MLPEGQKSGPQFRATFLFSFLIFFFHISFIPSSFTLLCRLSQLLSCANPLSFPLRRYLSSERTKKITEINVILFYHYFSLYPSPHAVFLGYHFFQTGIIHCVLIQHSLDHIQTLVTTIRN